jgi:hypothetical protein
LANTANNAFTPSGYKAIFKNLNASITSEKLLPLGRFELASYDGSYCAKQCSDTRGINGVGQCKGFNLYFERNPKVSLDKVQCPNPNGTTRIICQIWDTVFGSWNATRTGEKIEGFQIAIAGSNGYLNNTELSIVSGSGRLRVANALAVAAITFILTSFTI